MSSEGFSALDISSEGCATHPVGYNSPLQEVMAVWRASNLEKIASNGHYYMQRAATPDQITQQNSLQGAGGPKRQ
jgi:hypothetical protein